MTFEGLRGFRDYAPPDAGARSELLRRFRSVARRAGFWELEAPSVESLELFKVKSGDEINRQLWAFQDKGGREVTLVPEATPSLARIYAARAKSEPLPVKWFTYQRSWRYEEPQEGRTREFAQFNLDILGAPGVEAEAELLATAALAMDEAGAHGLYAFRINDRELAEAIGRQLGVADLPRYFHAVDRFRKLPRGEFVRELVASGIEAARAAEWADRLESWKAGVSGPAVESFFASVTTPGASSTADGAVVRLRRLFALLDRIGLSDRVGLDPTLVRGLAYYTTTVFEAFERNADRRSLFGGGRYDHLIELFGGPPTPACGLAIGDQTLELLLRAGDRWPEGEPPLDTYVIAITAAEVDEAFEWVERLRRSGVSAECDLLGRNLSRQLREAARKRARRALLIGPQEKAKGIIVERDLATGAQRELAPGEVVRPG
ncbi:MAG: histidine--tRNA ligase [Thermoplasmata archaeon]|nr:histidine--tRNA ligase [Thermoplasmata archaeon]